jgi:hypothetical protein
MFPCLMGSAKSNGREGNFNLQQGLNEYKKLSAELGCQGKENPILTYTVRGRLYLHCSKKRNVENHSSYWIRRKCVEGTFHYIWWKISVHMINAFYPPYRFWDSVLFTILRNIPRKHNAAISSQELQHPWTIGSLNKYRMQFETFCWALEC